MSKKTVLIVSVGIIVIGVILWYGVWAPVPPVTVPVAQDQSAAVSNASTSQDASGMSAPNDTSDTALDQDSAAIDAQLNGLNADSANANQSASAQ